MKHITVLLAALVLALGTQAVTRADPPAAAAAEAQKWKYQTLGVGTSMNVSTLNEMGALGWEAVGFVAAEDTVGTSDGYMVLFKRPAR